MLSDEPAAWKAAGFTVADCSVVVGRTRLVLGTADPGGRPGGDGRPRGVIGWWFDGVDRASGGDVVDGIPLLPVEPAGGAPDHPCGVVSLDHVVVASPYLDRTLEALVARGFELRRTRATRLGDRAATQAFLWAGDVILEVVGADGDVGEGPAAVWGLAFVARDLDASVAWWGRERCGPARDAVQAGRRIATLRTRALGIGVPIAIMTPHPRHEL